MNKKYFPSLEALRFFAFFKVYLQHVPSNFETPIFSFLKSGGGIGVTFFFVLSGFLITYLLAFEKKQNNRVDVKRFLIRRSLRIWPLFFLLTLAAFLLPYSFKDMIGMNALAMGYEFDWRYSFTFLENYKMLLEDNIPKTAHLSTFWSLCIEEHFYLVWVVALYFIPFKQIKYFLLVCIPVAWFARYFELVFIPNVNINMNDLFTNIDIFAIGGLLGLWIASNEKHFEWMMSRVKKPVKIGIVALLTLMVFFQTYAIPYYGNSVVNMMFRTTLIALLFVVIIAQFVPEKSGLKLTNTKMAYLGKISYGLYVYHVLINQFFIIVFRKFFGGIDDWYKLSSYLVITLLVTILVSHISYQYFEKPFLRFRDRF